MSFQAYLDAVEDKTGMTPAQLVDLAHERGFSAETKAAVVVEWLSTDFEVGRGHAMSVYHILKNGPEIGTKHVGSTGAHRDGSNLLRLDGQANRA